MFLHNNNRHILNGALDKFAKNSQIIKVMKNFYKNVMLMSRGKIHNMFEKIKTLPEKIYRKKNF